ncbi:MAG: 23S rRNA (uracil(1939)-C(5))-methyltransferase RlmD [Desulfatiglandaceae bacterium]
MDIPRKGQTVELEIERMAYGGKGLARIDNFVVFVRGAVPGDRVRAFISKKKRGFAEARVVELLSPSPDRVDAPCHYSPYCGGCQWQHIRYETQLSYKRSHVKEAVEHIGGLMDIPVHPVLPSKKQFAYRNKMEFSFSDRPWLLPEEMERGGTRGSFALGLHIPGAYQKVLDMDACLLQEQTGNEILRSVKRFAGESGAPIYGLKSHQGFWRFLTLRYSVAFDQWMVNVITSEERPDIMVSLAEDLASQFPNIATVANNINSRKASIAIGQQEKVYQGKGFIKDRIGRLTFRISPNSFFQTNSGTAEDLYGQVVKYAELSPTDRVLDLYSGTGTIPLFLAGHAQDVVGIEIVESAVMDARKNALANHIDNCRFICGDIREEMKSLSHRPQVLIIDPPREGMHKEVPAQILDLAPERIVYVSCNPTTLARDLALLAQRYEILEIQPVDMFPHTYHIEAVARLVRKG